MTSAALCVERIAHWQQLLELATARQPLDPAMRERVVSTCSERIAVWHRRLRRLNREAA
jgi:hypothetical protein